ncbi:hypothetical protein EIP91_007220 [Steccherinum ochraceum]|uniref:Uncharacterized protein n=1 Tax=Steccherinum ochraceum TaxID=92696 RepID=A0A4R0RA79_9APHY|nr:hypothetical protein EIP91_007220 [Steccherinum ochraceum]
MASSGTQGSRSSAGPDSDRRRATKTSLPSEQRLANDISVPSYTYTVRSCKIVCITGASRGIGRACAVECAKHGATGFTLHYLGDEVTEKEVVELKQEIESSFTGARVVTVPGDIADAATAAKASLNILAYRGPH